MDGETNNEMGAGDARFESIPENSPLEHKLKFADGNEVQLTEHVRILTVGIRNLLNAQSDKVNQPNLTGKSFEFAVKIMREVRKKDSTLFLRYLNSPNSLKMPKTRQDGKILVYCSAGISRSATLCMMYLVISEGITLRNSFIEVGKARPIICPNLGFWRQMIDYETNKKGTCSVALLKGGRHSIPDVYLYKTSLLKA